MRVKRSVMVLLCLTAALNVSCNPVAESSSSSAPQNSAPVCDAGTNQAVLPGDNVFLVGTASDADGDTLTYNWTASDSNPADVTLADSNSLVASFIAPSNKGTYRINLTVSDGIAQSTDFVLIAVDNAPPVANAGVNQSAHAGLTVTLNGSNSYDPNGDLLTFVWTEKPGNPSSVIQFTNTSTPAPSFIVTGTRGDYYFILVVSDGILSSTNEVRVTVTNSAPISEPGSWQVAAMNEVILLSGIGSSDPNGDSLTYQWTAKAGNPAAVGLTNANTVNASFLVTTNLPDGDYTFVLTVSDGSLSAASEVIVSIDAMSRLIMETPGSQVRYGFSTAMNSNGQVMLIGSLYNGYVDVSRRSGTNWTISSISSSDTEVRFGTAVAISYDGNTALVGDYGLNSYRGAAYLFTWNGSSWSQAFKFTNSDGTADDQFGSSLALSADGTRAVVGAWAKNNSSGCVYIYNKNGAAWDETKITPSGLAVNDRAGYSVSISGDGSVVAVSCHLKNSSRGRVYIYRFNGTTWDETYIDGLDIYQTVGQLSPYYGQSVSLDYDGDTLAAGAPGFDTFGNNGGAVLIHKYNGSAWTNHSVVANPPWDGISYYSPDEFGKSVALSADGNTFFAGAWQKVPSYTGSAYRCRWNGSAWVSTEMKPTGLAINKYYGEFISMSASGEYCTVGHFSEDVSSVLNAGAVYQFRYK